MIESWTASQGMLDHWAFLDREGQREDGRAARVLDAEQVFDVLHRADSAMRHAMATAPIAKPAREEFGSSFREIDDLLREEGRVLP